MVRMNSITTMAVRPVFHIPPEIGIFADVSILVTGLMQLLPVIFAN